MEKQELISYLSICIEKGKDRKETTVPPELKGKDGAVEIVQMLLDSGADPNEILNSSLVPAMDRIGQQYSEGKVFVPHLLLAARAMNAALNLLKPYFESGDLKNRGVVVMGTVKGDLHDIGKNIVKSIIEGSGYKVVDLGTDVDPKKFMEVLEEYPDASIGLSALLTTTMVNMKEIVDSIKDKYPDKKIIIGGAPVTDDFCAQIGADFYSSDPKKAVEFLNQIN